MKKLLILNTIICIACTVLACTNSTPKTLPSNPTEENVQDSQEASPSESQAKNQPLDADAPTPAANEPTPVAEKAPTKREPCVVPLTTNPIPKEKQRPFIVTYETYKDNVRIKIFVNTTYDNSKNLEYPLDIEYDCDMDGIYEKKLLPGRHAYSMSCYYENAGLHQIAMRGDIPHLVLDFLTEYTNDYDVEHYNLISVDQWGDIRWKDMTELLASKDKYNPKTKSYHYPLLKAKDTPDLRDVCKMTSMFGGNKEFNANISSWDVSHVEDMYGLFSGCTKFNQDISQWNVSNVKTMSKMFENCNSFNQDISEWDISSLEVVYNMFKSKDDGIICPKCESFRQKVLEKNNHLPPEQKKLNFEYPHKYNY